MLTDRQTNKKNTEIINFNEISCLPIPRNILTSCLIVTTYLYYKYFSAPKNFSCYGIILAFD